MDMHRYKHNDWFAYSSGDAWAPLGYSSWVGFYTRKPFAQGLDYFLTQTIMVWDGVASTCYVRESERERFGKKVVAKVKRNPAYIDTICNGFRSGTDCILSLYRKRKKAFTYQEYEDYITSFLTDYYQYHIQVKNVVDCLPKKLLDIHLPKLEAARLYAEPVFSREVGYVKRIAQCISTQCGYKPEHALFIFHNELVAYWRDGKPLPKESVLAARSKSSVMFFEKGIIQDVLIGTDAQQFSGVFVHDDNERILKGQTVFGGAAKGTVRVILDPSAAKDFNEGDILVAPFTRPEYLPIMKKAGAFITDGGGILSHAALSPVN